MTENPVPALGDIIEAHCTHCRLNLDCNVAAVVEGAVKQVQCRTCGNFVAHKPPVDMAQRKQEQIRRLMKMQAKTRTASDGGAKDRAVLARVASMFFAGASVGSAASFRKFQSTL